MENEAEGEQADSLTAAQDRVGTYEKHGKRGGKQGHIPPASSGQGYKGPTVHNA